MGNLDHGIEITTHGIQTRLVARPANGFQAQSVHVLTLNPGKSGSSYTFGMAEEAMCCLWGAGELFLRESWVDIAAGDFAYFPADVGHGIRNPAANKEDLLLLSQICLSQFDLSLNTLVVDNGSFSAPGWATLPTDE